MEYLFIFLEELDYIDYIYQTNNILIINNIESLHNVIDY